MRSQGAKGLRRRVSTCTHAAPLASPLAPTRVPLRPLPARRRSEIRSNLFLRLSLTDRFGSSVDWTRGPECCSCTWCAVRRECTWQQRRSSCRLLGGHFLPGMNGDASCVGRPIVSLKEFFRDSRKALRTLESVLDVAHTTEGPHRARWRAVRAIRRVPRFSVSCSSSDTAACHREHPSIDLVCRGNFGLLSPSPMLLLLSTY